MWVDVFLFSLIFVLFLVCFYQAFLIHRYKKSKRRGLEKQTILEVQLDRINIFRKVVETSPSLFVMVDQSLQVIVVNKMASEYGWLASHPFMQANISDTSKLHFEFEIKHVLETGNPTDGEIRLVREENQNWKYYLYHIFPIRDEELQIIGATITALDITAQRAAENELHRQREFLEGIMNAIPDSIYVTNDRREWIYGNQAFSNLIGKAPEDYIGKKEEGVLPPVNAHLVRKWNQEALRTGLSNEMEEEYLDPAGRKKTVLSVRTPFQFHDGRKLLISVMRDISERKKLETELQISRARQEEASRLATLGETAGGIAHEINNPLNVLVGMAELMKMTLEKEGSIHPEKLKEYCDRFVKYSMRIAKIVKSLRAISRNASQDPFADVELIPLLEEAIELCQQQYSSRGIELRFERPDYPVIVQGRFAQISQIIMNLLNNARDAVEGTANPIIYAQVLIDKNHGVFRIWDSGPGIPEAIEPKIMNPFFTTKPVGKGTGLGLSISRAIVEDHNGTLLLNRKVANSCFEVSLPLVKPLRKVS